MGGGGVGKGGPPRTFLASVEKKEGKRTKNRAKWRDKGNKRRKWAKMRIVFPKEEGKTFSADPPLSIKPQQKIHILTPKGAATVTLLDVYFIITYL